MSGGYHYHYHHPFQHEVPPPPAHGQAHPPPAYSQPAPPPSAPALPQPRSVKIFCRANVKYNLTIRNDVVVLAAADKNDECQVRLLPYNPDYLDESLLWTETTDKGDGFRGIRMVNNMNLHFDAINGDKAHEGVHDGTGLQLFKWWNGDNLISTSSGKSNLGEKVGCVCNDPLSRTQEMQEFTRCV